MIVFFLCQTFFSNSYFIAIYTLIDSQSPVNDFFIHLNLYIIEKHLMDTLKIEKCNRREYIEKERCVSLFFSLGDH